MSTATHTFYPRFLVLDQTGQSPVAEAKTQSQSGLASQGGMTSQSGLASQSGMASQGGLPSHSYGDLLSDFKNEVSQSDVSLNLICFETVNESGEIAEMLSKLVQAVKMNSYRLYQFPQEVESNLRGEQLVESLMSTENSTDASTQISEDKNFLFFSSKWTSKTSAQTIEGSKSVWISTYGLKDLSADVEKKKDLWLTLKKHFN